MTSHLTPIGQTSAILIALSLQFVPSSKPRLILLLLGLPNPIPYNPLRVEESLLARKRQPYNLGPSAQVYILVSVFGFVVKPSDGVA